MKNINKAEKISITLPSEMLDNIKSKVQAGAYGSTSEVIREAMRLWQLREDEHQAHLDAIRVKLDRSANSGTPIPIEQAFDKIAEQHQQKMKGK